MANAPDAASPLSPTRIACGEADFPSALSTLLGDAAPAHLTVLGERSVLEQPLLGFFCSRRAPGSVILRAYDWAREARDAGVPVIGGFQSPMERECLDFLLRGTQPVVVCPARGIGGMRLSRERRDAIERGRLLVLSPFLDRPRRVDGSGFLITTYPTDTIKVGGDMDKIRVIHDTIGHTLTLWVGDPRSEHIAGETADEVVVMKDVQGRVIGVEVLHYRPVTIEPGLAVETVVR